MLHNKPQKRFAKGINALVRRYASALALEDLATCSAI